MKSAMSSSVRAAGLLNKQQVGKSKILGARNSFVARRHFVVNRKGQLPISAMGPLFRKKYLGVVEVNVRRKCIRTFYPSRPVKSGLILEYLSGLTGTTSIALAHVYEYLRTADRDRRYAFFVKGKSSSGRVPIMYALWFSQGWLLGAAKDMRTENLFKGKRHIVFS